MGLKVLAVDPSYFAGIAVVDFPNQEEFPRISDVSWFSMPRKLRYKNMPQGDVLLERVQPFIEYLLDMFNKHEPDIVAWEIANGSPNAFTMRSFGRWDGIAVGVFGLMDTNLLFVSPANVKVWARKIIRRNKKAIEAIEDEYIKIAEKHGRGLPYQLKKKDVVLAATSVNKFLLNEIHKNRLEAMADATAIAFTVYNMYGEYL